MFYLLFYAIVHLFLSILIHPLSISNLCIIAAINLANVNVNVIAIAIVFNIADIVNISSTHY